MVVPALQSVQFSKEQNASASGGSSSKNWEDSRT